MRPDPQAPEQSIVTTVIKQDVAALNLGTISTELPRHRGYHHHQVMVWADAGSAGDWDIKIVPDVDGGDEQRAVDTGENLTLGGEQSAMTIFPAALKAIVLQQVVAGTTGRELTFIITSAKGQLINP